MTSWRTSLIGLVLIVIGIAGMAFAALDKVMGGAIITAGLGFLAAKDSQVHGGTVSQATPLEVQKDSELIGLNIGNDPNNRRKL